MINKKGALVLRDVMFMMLIVSSIFVLAGLFVSDMSLNYGNTNMSDEWAIKGTNSLANSTFYDTKDELSTTGDNLDTESTGIWSLISGAGQVLDGIGDALFMVLTAPNTIGDLIYTILMDMGAGKNISMIIKYLIVSVLWAIVIFTIASAFLRGGKL